MLFQAAENTHLISQPFLHGHEKQKEHEEHFHAHTKWLVGILVCSDFKKVFIIVVYDVI